MNILDRIRSESTEIGKWFQYKIPILLIVLGAINEGISQLDSDTAQLVPCMV